MPNLEALNRAVTQIVDHPETHQQDVWTCATGACLAGHGVLMNGYLRTPVDGYVTTPENYSAAELLGNKLIELRAKSVAACEAYDAASAVSMVEDAAEYVAWQQARSRLSAAYDRFEEVALHVRELALKIFDISMETAEVLFHGTNTAENIALMVKDLSNGENISNTFTYESGGGYVPVKPG